MFSPACRCKLLPLATWLAVLSFQATVWVLLSALQIFWRRSQTCPSSTSWWPGETCTLRFQDLWFGSGPTTSFNLNCKSCWTKSMRSMALCLKRPRQLLLQLLVRQMQIHLQTHLSLPLRGGRGRLPPRPPLLPLSVPRLTVPRSLLQQTFDLRFVYQTLFLGSFGNVFQLFFGSLLVKQCFVEQTGLFS